MSKNNSYITYAKYMEILNALPLLDQNRFISLIACVRGREERDCHSLLVNYALAQILIKSLALIHIEISPTCRVMSPDIDERKAQKARNSYSYAVFTSNNLVVAPTMEHILIMNGASPASEDSLGWEFNPISLYGIKEPITSLTDLIDKICPK